jgi:serine protease Do
MRTCCRYTELNYHAVPDPGDALTRNVKCRSKEDLFLADIKVRILVGAPVYFLFLMFLFFMVLPDRAIAINFNPKQLYEEVSRSIVAVTGSDSKYGKRSIGAGSIIHKDGLVLTNAHIIFNKENKRPFKNLFIILKPDQVTGNLKNDTSRMYRAELLHYSRKLDLALIKIVSTSVPLLRPINFADSTFVSIGDSVLAIGHPENGGLWSLTTGTISSKINNYQKIAGKNVFQTETSLNRGNSGGPLIDENGRLVGVNSMFSRISKDGLPMIGINFSIMSNVAVRWIQSLRLNIDFAQDQQITRPLIIQEASIVPVPELGSVQSDVVPQPKNQKTSKALKKIKPLKKDAFKLFENDLEKMMSAMRDKIKNKKILSENR